MDPRQYCATCRHIVHVRDGRGASGFFCSRLGWRTEPRWRFQCWSPRPRQEKMPRRTADDRDKP